MAILERMWYLFLFLPECALGVTSTTLSPVHVEEVSVRGAPSDRRLVDADGRERLFRGINVVYKDYPYLPTAVEFNTNSSWVAGDAKFLASLGFNLIRLSVMWPGVMPEGIGSVNKTYIAEIKKLIAIAAAEGMYTILEPHQDEFSPRFCGEGAPNWWVLEHTDVGDFPVPVRSKPFPRDDPDRPCPPGDQPCDGLFFPGRERCDLNSSFSYIWTHAGAKAYQTLWESGSDSGFASFWSTVADEFHGLPGVIGGEVWNEPFPGDVFEKPEMRNNQHADRVNLAPFYANVTRAIRASVPSKTKFAIAYEPSWPVGDQDLHPQSMLPSTSGFETLAEDNAIYAFHWYSPPADRNLSRYLDARVADARRLKAAPYASEWAFGDNWDYDLASCVLEFESRRIAYTGWQYKTYQAAIPGGTCTGCGSQFFNDDGTMQEAKLQSLRLVGPFTQAVAGWVLSISVTPWKTEARNRQYILKYINHAKSAAQATEIVVSTAWLAREKLEVVVSDSDTAVVTMTEVPGGTLTDLVEYQAWTKIKVLHKTSSSREVSLTIRAKDLMVV